MFIFIYDLKHALAYAERRCIYVTYDREVTYVTSFLAGCDLTDPSIENGPRM